MDVISIFSSVLLLYIMTRQCWCWLFQGYHGLSKDDDRLWAMEIDREHSRGGGALHHPHTAAHTPLAWTGLVETLPPPPGALPLPPPPPHNSLAGDPNGHPPPGNSGTPVSTGHTLASQESQEPGQVTAGLSLLADSLLDINMVSIILQLGTAVPGAELLPAQPLVPTTPTAAGRGHPPPPPPPPPVGGSGPLQGPVPGSGGPRTLLRSGRSPTRPGSPPGQPWPSRCLTSMVTTTSTSLLTATTRGRWPPAGSGELLDYQHATPPATPPPGNKSQNQITNQPPLDQPGLLQLELFSQVGPLHVYSSLHVYNSQIWKV